MISRKLSLLIFLIVFVIAGVISFLIFKEDNVSLMPKTNYKPPDTNDNKTKVNNKETTTEAKTEECPLNGQLLGKSNKEKWIKRRPLGIMVENSTDARPQSGLSAADIIYEAVAEGGITRFLTIYYCQEAAYIGPVRSARIYFVKLLQEFGDYPLYAHVGGANTDGPADALGEIDDLGWGFYNDLSQFAVPFPYYWRDYERLPGRVTEHTVYTNASKLWDYAKTKRSLTNKDKKGQEWDAKFTNWKFVDEASLEARGNISKISLTFWDLNSSDYAVDWVYDKNSNSFKRSNGGSPHLDKNTGKRLESKNVVIIFARESPANDGYPGGHLIYKLTGSGDGLIFQDGKAIEISWSKKTEESRMRFFDGTGKEMAFVRGQIFVEIVPIGNKVTY